MCRQFGRLVELKPTGERKRPTCRRNGTTKRKSRYFTVSAVSHRPVPMAVTMVSRMNSGSSATRQSGANRHQRHRAASSTRTTAKSINATATDDSGTMSRGK